MLQSDDRNKFQRFINYKNKKKKNNNNIITKTQCTHRCMHGLVYNVLYTSPHIVIKTTQSCTYDEEIESICKPCLYSFIPVNHLILWLNK